jgi:type IV pilus assembly protein PilM
MHTKLSGAFFSYLPPPALLSMNAAGVDISDRSVKFIVLERRRNSFAVTRYGDYPLPPGVVVGGEIRSPEGLAEELRKLKEKEDLSLIRISIPEQRGYLFQTTLEGITSTDARSVIEFQLEEHVPLSPSEALFDAELIEGKRQGSLSFVVTAFPEKVVSLFASTYRAAGLSPLSVEIEAQAIARSLIPQGDSGTFLIVDFGDTHTGLSVVSRGIVHYTSTIEVAGKSLTSAISKCFSVSLEQAEDIKRKNNYFEECENKEVLDSLMTTMSVLRDEVTRHYEYWNNRTEKEPDVPKIEQVLLCGGNANLHGLSEYLAAGLRVPVSIGNVWTNVASSHDYIPPIGAESALGYATAIGLALRREQ